MCIASASLLRPYSSGFVDPMPGGTFWQLKTRVMTHLASTARRLLKLSLFPPRPASLVAKGQHTATADATGHSRFQQPADDSLALQTKVAQLEAQVRRRSAEFAPAGQTPSPVCSPQPSHGRSSSLPAAQVNTHMDIIVQLKQMNTRWYSRLTF